MGRPGELLWGRIDTRSTFECALDVLTTWNVSCDAWVLSGDLTHHGDAETYAWVRDRVQSRAAEVGAQVVWAAGNHDDLELFARELWATERTGGPLNREHWVGGLRILVVDTVVPGAAHGQIAPETITWLSAHLRRPAPEGTFLVLHHAPLPVVQDAAAAWSLRNRKALADAIGASDVRGIWSGHFHQTSHGTLAGVPVSLATSLAYTQDLTAGRTLLGQDAHQGFSLISVFDDCTLTTAVPLTPGASVHTPMPPGGQGFPQPVAD